MVGKEGAFAAGVLKEAGGGKNKGMDKCSKIMG